MYIFHSILDYFYFFVWNCIMIICDILTKFIQVLSIVLLSNEAFNEQLEVNLWTLRKQTPKQFMSLVRLYIFKNTSDLFEQKRFIICTDSVLQSKIYSAELRFGQQGWHLIKKAFNDSLVVFVQLQSIYTQQTKFRCLRRHNSY